jgi:glycerophosphoryl diester phosphodiesterase
MLCLCATAPCANAAEPQARPRIVAHRGLLKHAPENTLANFRACLELQIGFEFDVERTKDGHLVCIHDTTVDRTTNGKGRVADLSLAEVRQLDAGSWFDPRFAGERVPTIDEVLALVAEHRQRDVLIAVDLKADKVGAEVAALAVKRQVLERLIFIGKAISDAKVRDEIREAAPKAATAAVVNKPEEFAEALTANASWVYFRFLPSAEQMQAVRGAGKRSFIAGVTVAGNLPDNWRTATQAGLDGILTDFPLELAAQLRTAAAR